uniref:Nuclear shuttle protein n=1 Tax=Strongyloides venezuelensis TaxID=75913 RepID=A0A0K0EWR6_STRVS
MSQIVHCRTYALCMTNITKCDKNYLTRLPCVLGRACTYIAFNGMSWNVLCLEFSYDMLDNNVFHITSIILFDGSEIILKIHCILGDHLLMQSIFKHVQNYRSVGRINACRACTLLPNEYESHMTCSMIRNFLKKQNEEVGNILWKFEFQYFLGADLEYYMKDEFQEKLQEYLKYV